MASTNCKVHKITFSPQNTLDVLREIYLSGNFEPVNSENKIDQSLIKDTQIHLDSKKTKVAKVLQLLKTNITKSNKKDLTTSLPSKELLRNFKAYDKKADLILGTSEKHNSILSSISNIENKLSKLEDFKDLDYTYQIKGEDDLYNSLLIKTDKELFREIVQLISVKDGITINKIKEVDTSIYSAISYTEDNTSFTNDLIKNYTINYLPKLNYQNNPSREYTHLFNLIKSNKEDLSKLNSEINDYVISDYENFNSLNSLLIYESDVISSLQYVDYVEGDKEANIRGWILSEDTEVSDRYMDLKKGVRSKMTNNTFFRPFEVITKMVGQPASKELDPTTIMAPFFILFFGFAFGDVVYGLVLLATAFFLYRKNKNKDSMIQIAKLASYCGIASVIFGVLMGSWAGLPLKEGGFLDSLKVIDVRDKLLDLLVVVLLIGFGQQILGYALEAFNFIKKGKKKDALLGPGTWIMFIAFFGISFYTGFHKNSIFKFIAILVALIFAYGQGRNTKNPLLRPVMGLGSLFDITGIMSNTLSYARLIALGLSTGVIAQVINQMALPMIESGNILMYIPFILIMLFGHTFNILLSVLGTFINVLRLQLVEFFPRFFKAEGIELQPLQKSTAVKSVEVNSTDLRYLNSIFKS